jgi:rhodanese-related sulfurtransferase
MAHQHSSAFEQLVAQAKQQIQQTDITTVKQKLDQGEAFYLIDVREDHEWDQGHIPGAMHLGRGIIERDIAKVIADKHAELVLYCGGGFRSALAAYNLQQMGYQQVYSMDGGLRAWQQARYDTE